MVELYRGMIILEYKLHTCRAL